MNAVFTNFFILNISSFRAFSESFLAAEFKNRWTKSRDALRMEDRLVWDDMWKATEIHRDVINAMDGVSEFEKQFMAMIIEKTKLNNEIEAKLDDPAKRFSALEKKS